MMDFIRADALDVISEIIGAGSFFTSVFEFLRDEINGFQAQLLRNLTGLMIKIGLVVLTVWVFFQGWKIVSGRMRGSAMEVVGDSLKAVLIVGIASGWGLQANAVYNTLTQGLESAIYGLVSTDELHGLDHEGVGEGGDSVYESIETNMQIASLAMIAMDQVSSHRTGGNGQVENNSMFLEVMVLAGSSGPALTGGAMILLYEVAMALFTGLGPLFILCLLFDQTKSLFQRWLLYGIGTMFALAVLYVMSGIVMRLMAAVGVAIWLPILASKGLDALGSGGIDLGGLGGVLSGILGGATATPFGLRESALQIAGLGLVMTTLLISAPPMAAAFFQGTLGQFMHYSAFNSLQSSTPSAGGQPPGTYASPTKQGTMPDSNVGKGQQPHVALNSRGYSQDVSSVKQAAHQGAERKIGPSVPGGGR
ncbi:type IV secretion system protein VirB6 [Pseudoxanthomonas sp. GM95]|uniref:type IV secretion system protein n=1 Tax=Pseudoxanthomonas sp. GM95 TaxID=1881043 RepID=UPI0008D24C53|nr:type IV secretion system protein [Pseudoxanthomonas sp. GM95]SEK70124.1 type IV secretion system protein VirB6 [Pseudoxanthomonas sp. GM95]